MKVILPSPLAEYTAGRREVQSSGATIAGLLVELDRQYPGIRFRMIDEQDAVRSHIKVFVNRELVRSLSTSLAPDDEILIVAALSGG